MDEQEIKQFAERALELGENNLSILLYVYLGAKEMGTDRVLAELSKEFAKGMIQGIQYSKWIDEG